MARQLRIEFPGAFYHVMARGIEKRVLFKSDCDRQKFLDYLEAATSRYRAVVHCFCLMDNHYHLMLETPAGNLSQIMRYLNGSYSTYFNKRHERVGHVFQGRYKSELVDADAYCLQLSRYIHLNPVKGGLVVDPWDYQWSSCGLYTNDYSSSEWLTIDFVLSFFGRQDAVKDYKDYLSKDGIAEELNDRDLSRSEIVGHRKFVGQVYDEHLRKIRGNRDLPGLQKLKERSSILSIVDAVSHEMNNDERMTKKMSLYLCHRFSGYSLKEIGQNFGVGESAVTESSNRFAAVLHADQRLAETVARLLSVLDL